MLVLYYIKIDFNILIFITSILYILMNLNIFQFHFFMLEIDKIFFMSSKIVLNFFFNVSNTDLMCSSSVFLWC